MSSPTRAGFAAAFRHPSAVFGEILWRWSFGAGALLLAGAAILRLFGTLTVSDSELNALRGHDLYPAAAALLHIFEGSGPRFLRAFVIVLPAVSLLWILLASLGRQFTLRQLLSRQRPNAASFSAMLAAHLLRVLLALLGFTAWLAAILFAAYAGESFSSTYGSPNLLVYFLFLALLLPIIFLFWGMAHWYLALAPIFIVRDASGAAASVAAAWRAVRQRRSAFSSVSTAYGALRFIALVFVTVAAAVGAALASAAGNRTTVAVVAALSLTYFAFADFLYIARLAAYVAIVEAESTSVAEVTARGAEAIPEEGAQPALPVTDEQR